MELPRQRHIRFFQRPHFDTGSDHQCHGCIKCLESADVQIGMRQFLQNFCRSTERSATPVGLGKELPGMSL